MAAIGEVKPIFLSIQRWLGILLYFHFHSLNFNCHKVFAVINEMHINKNHGFMYTVQLATSCHFQWKTIFMHISINRPKLHWIDDEHILTCALVCEESMRKRAEKRNRRYETKRREEKVHNSFVACHLNNDNFIECQPKKKKHGWKHTSTKHALTNPPFVYVENFDSKW